MNVFFVYYEDSRTPDNVRELIAAVIDALSVKRSQVFNVAEASPESISALAPRGSTWVLHNTATYFPAFTARLFERIKSLTPAGPIIVMKQDDHLAPGEFDDLFVKFEVTSVATYLDQTQVAVVYPKAKMNGVSFVRVNVGYLTQRLLRARPQPLGSILKGSYRGSLQPFSLGRLGFDKAMLPSQIFSQSREMGMREWVFDVSSRWPDRLYGRAWEDFLNNSRVIFTTESGSNSFDLDGNLRSRTDVFEQLNGKLSWDDVNLVLRYFDEVLVDFEGNVQGGTFSPRNLEAGILGRPQVAIRGHYGGLFDGFETQFFIERDLSNFSDVMARFSDVALATNAANEFRESLLSRDELRVEDFKASIFRSVEQAQDSTISQSIFNTVRTKRREQGTEIIILSPSPYEADPRTEWWARTFENSRTNCSILEWLGDEDAEAGWRVWGLPSSPETQSKHRQAFDVANPALLTLVRAMCKSPDYEVSWRARRIFNMLLALANVSGRFLPQGIVACDLESAVIANILWGDSAVILYDAQEMPAEQLGDASTSSRALFCALERAAVRESDLTVTVSPGAAAYYSEAYGITPLIVPNFLPQNLSDAVDAKGVLPSSRGEIVRFVFFGRFSAGRAIERMIEDWPGDPTRRELYIYAEGLKRGPKHKEAQLREEGVFVCDPVSTENLSTHLQNFDVGLIPYDYEYPYNHASPNKFGQYLDAGLAIVSSDTPFVGDLVAKFEIGEVFSWRDPEGYRQAIEKMTARLEIDSEATRQSVCVAKSTLNWESFAKPVCEDFFDLIFSRLPDKNLTDRDFVPVRVPTSLSSAAPIHRRVLASLFSWSIKNQHTQRAVKVMVPRSLRRLVRSYLEERKPQRSLYSDTWVIPA